MTDLAKNDLDIIFDSTYVGMIAINSDGIVPLFNKAAERITGLKAEDVIGNPAIDVIPNTRLHLVLAGGMAEIGQEQDLGNTIIITNRVPKSDFQSYGTRRGNHAVMLRGTFANLRIRNLMLPPKSDGSLTEGGHTLFQPSGEQSSIYDAAMKYRELQIPTIVFGGEEYRVGSSRGWAAKGTQLLGVRAVISRSFERIHRSNLVGMGVLPLQFMGSDSVQVLAKGGRGVRYFCDG